MTPSLLELQNADNHIARLHRERARLDDGTAARADRDTLQSARDEAAAAFNTVSSQRTAKEDEQKDIENKIARSNTRLMQASSAHEVTALERDLKGLGARRGELDEAILELMDETETAAAHLADVEDKLRAAVAHTIEIEKQFAREAARLEAELVAAVAARDEVQQTIDPPSLKKYQEYAKRFGGVAVAHPEKGNCSACGMALTPFNLKEAKTQDWPTCENCSRLLYIEH